MVDFIIIGGGIVGVCTAWQLQNRYPNAKVILIEKENRLASHQTGRNSGVIHAGVYYAPGSLKADFCKRGAAATVHFCKENDLPFEQCGKLLVATNEGELNRMESLKTRCRKNGIKVTKLSRLELQKQEPAIIGKGALYVPSTGITNYTIITNKMARKFKDAGGKIYIGHVVRRMKEAIGVVKIQTDNRDFYARYLVVCGGLMADRLARLMGIDIDFRIIPFRGEYYALYPKEKFYCHHLIYPIPDPQLPFLGVHITRMTDQTMTVGPNAVLGWKREGYGRININLRDSMEMLFFSGFWHVVSSHMRSGLEEWRDSILKKGYLKRVQKYAPGVAARNLKPYPTGIRAQAVLNNGELVHDFLFAETELSLHVCNAPSPAATSAIPIGEHICDRLKEKFSL